MTLKNIMVGLLLGSLATLGLMAFSTDVFSTYNVSYEGLESFDVSSRMINETGGIRSELSESEPTDTESSSPFSTIKGIWRTLTLPIVAIDILQNLVTDAISALYLPPYLGYVIFGIIGMVILFQIIYVVLGRRL